MIYTLVFSLVLFCSINNCLTASDTPSITNVEQIDANKIQIKWKIHDSSADITRYRLFYTDSSSSDLNEWPSQMEKVDAELNGTPLTSLNVLSTFQCYISCINNVQCEFAEYRNLDDASVDNCFLKTLITDEEVNTDDTDGIEYYKLKKYTGNEAIVKDLLPNDKYTFIVSVYDQNLKKWSLNSRPSSPVEVKIGMSIKVLFHEDNNANISWEQTGKFKNYPISRYNIKIWINDSDTPTDYNVKNEIIKYDVVHDLYDLKFTAILKNDVQSGEDCVNLCIEENTCIRYVYFYETKKCYLLSRVNLLKSVHRAKNSEIEGLISNANMFEIPFKLVPDVNYKIKIEYKTIYGAYGVSNTLLFSLPNKKTPSIEIDTKKIVKKVGEEEYLGCKLFDSNSDEIIWTKSGLEITENVLQSDAIGYVNSALSFKSLKLEDDGVYRCAIKDNALIYKEITLIVRGPPAKPIIKEVFILPDGKTTLKWTVDHIGGEDHLNNAFIQYSSNFSDITQIVKSAEIYWDSSKKDELNNQEVTIDDTIPEYNQVKLELETVNGISEKSDIFLARCQDENNCPTKARASGVKREDKTKKSINNATIILIVLIALIVLAICIFIIYQNCCIKKPVSKNEYGPVPLD